MIRLELRPALSIELRAECNFYEMNNDLIVASDIADEVLETGGDFGALPREERRKRYEGYIQEASSVLRFPEPFKTYDLACAQVDLLVNAIVPLRHMRHGAIPINSLTYKASPASTEGYRPFSKHSPEEYLGRAFIAGFRIRGAVIPNQFVKHLATLSPGDTQPLHELEEVFGVKVSPAGGFNARNVVVCAYGRNHLADLLEDIEFQRDSA